MVFKHLTKMLRLKTYFNKNEKEQTPLIEIKTTYYFIIASNNFLLVNEPVEEILRERVQHYQREKKPIDFWLVKSPKFLEARELTSVRNTLADAKLLGSCSTIISLDKNFIVWLKLRLNNVLIGSFEAPSKEISSPLSSSL